MANVESVKIESEDRGFELHLTVGDDIVQHDDGSIVLNIHAVAEDLLRECVREIGPWLLEGLRVKREVQRTPFDQGEDEEPWPGESAIDFYRRTGDTGLLFEHADTLRKSRRETPDVGA